MVTILLTKNEFREVREREKKRMEMNNMNNFPCSVDNDIMYLAYASQTHTANCHGFSS